MKLRLIGDIHGNMSAYKQLIKGADYSIQIGDFGVGFTETEPTLEEANLAGNHRFIRGNHDNPKLCKQSKFWIPDGTKLQEEGVMLLGGAWSIDKDYRTPGYDWWEAEQLSEQELEELEKQYVDFKPKIMITHDCPTLAAYYVFMRDPDYEGYGEKALYFNRTAEALQRMFEKHQPEHWFFGHWHRNKNLKLGPCTFHCIGINSVFDIEV